ncbi:SubName: Full=Uncharacterized protein {ECO:0000313/EMBL:CCA68050.1} [Serendipita indica DSM 11827]|uniref:BRCT domain-containing protein n=1 Tax=Serendipita indica (strain DSM 11827) TaxID=1109443 RepID=G4T9N9_SERID|nr:SubName: Full=Uncharacterized protein {ECO:0000313/EMBL:CCA68050.1} [Serendipita indica DSM 11827]CCA68050.1 hypothetical protein PIIN_01917 [Serendipita indica DSM 11827]
MDISSSTQAAQNTSEIFVDPLQGNPLVCYVHSDVKDRLELVKQIQNHGGSTSTSYTNATYILVDATSIEGHNLYIMFNNTRKSKTVLDSRWVSECIDAGKVLGFRDDWGGCRVTGKEREEFLNKQQEEAEQIDESPERDELGDESDVLDPGSTQDTPTSPEHPGANSEAGRLPHTMYYGGHPLMYGYPARPGNGAAPIPTPMPWPYLPNGQPMPFAMGMPMFAPPFMHQEGHEGQPAAVPGAYPTYDMQQLQAQAQAYSNAWMSFYPQMDPAAYARQLEESGFQLAVEAVQGQEQTAVASSVKLALKTSGRPARSPTPPTRVVKSMYGGNLFTEDDVQYLKRYIDYCQEQGLLLSLREICERLAAKARNYLFAPHHTFFSWRRYCNKHQIRLGAYTLEDRNSGNNSGEEEQSSDEEANGQYRSIPSTSTPSGRRSPTPPKTLYKSTTGKGVAFTPEDVKFLMDYLKYRRESTENLDMVEFWNDLARKAPHHSRASWMKYWRRHRHELEPHEDDIQVPVVSSPSKKARYTRKDDILLAHYFIEFENSETAMKKTSDKLFQEFAVLHPHHPWKGWQEHHRLHKAQIDHIIKQIKEGALLRE